MTERSNPMNHTKNQHMPPWARRIDEYGKRNWHRDHPRSRKGEYIGNLLFNLIFLWVFNKVPEWNLVFIKDNYNVILWALDINIIVQICGNALMILFDAAFVRHFSKMVMEAASFVMQMVLFYIFPFDFTNFHGLVWLNWLIPHGGFGGQSIFKSLEIAFLERMINF